MFELINQLVHIVTILGLANGLNFSLLSSTEVRENDPGKLPLALDDDLVCEFQRVVVVKDVSQDETSDQEEILIMQEHVAASELSIAASSPNLLDVVLNALWHVIVDDRLNVTLVNAHTEGNRAHETPHLVCDKKLLNSVSLLVRLSSVVRLRVYPVLLKLWTDKGLQLGRWRAGRRCACG